MPDRHERIEMLYSLRRYADAESLAREQIAESPEDAYAYSQLAMCLASDFERYNESIAAVKTALKYDALHPFSHYLHGWLQHRKFEYRGAARSFRKALKLAPEYTSARVGLANVFFDMGRYRKFIAVVKEGLRFDPIHADLLEQTIRLQLQCFRHRTVIRRARRALSRHPNDARFHYYLAKAREQQGDDLKPERRRPYYVAASRSIRRALKLDPTNEQYQTSKKRIEQSLRDDYSSHTESRRRMSGVSSWITMSVLFAIGFALIVGFLVCAVYLVGGIIRLFRNVS